MLLSLLRCERFVSLCVGLLITQFIFLDITQHQLHVNKKTTKVDEMAFSKTIAIKFSRRLKTMEQVPRLSMFFPTSCTVCLKNVSRKQIVLMIMPIDETVVN